MLQLHRYKLEPESIPIDSNTISTNVFLQKMQLAKTRKFCFECVVIDHDPEDNLDKDFNGASKGSRNSLAMSRVEKSEQIEIWRGSIAAAIVDVAAEIRGSSRWHGQTAFDGSV
ncbi:hypothetical protein C5167_007310 [Papaver somniferum]|nr:hypothetical protein C5167_007310 [Papaver somniferum]